MSAGTLVQLQWDTRDATSVQLADAAEGPVPGVQPDQASGSVEVVVNQTTLFILTARNDRGVRESAVLQVAVKEGPEKVLFVATPRQIAAGESSVLAWSAPGASELAIADDAGNPIDLGAQRETGSVRVAPTVTTTYRLTVDGDEYEAQVRVNPRVDLFSATPEAALAGEPLTLSWQLTGASKIGISLAPGGEIHSEADPSKVASGSHTIIIPTSLTQGDVLTFTLRAEGASAESYTEQKLTVHRAGAPKITAFNVPPYAREGQTFTISWKTVGTETVELLRNGVVVYRSPDSVVASAGSVELPTPATDESYQLRATHSRSGEVVSAVENVNPVGAPTLVSFEIGPDHIANGGDPVTVTWDVPNARNVRLRVKDSIVVFEKKGPSAETGSASVYPNKDTEWVLEADNGLGESVESAAPKSTTVASPATFTFTPSFAVPVGAPLTISASSVNGTSIVTGLPHANVVHNAPGEAFIDIARTGVDIGYVGPSKTTQVVTLPETFTTSIYGEAVSTDRISVNINGWMKFGASTVQESGTEIAEPLPSARLDPLALAPFWEDLNTRLGDESVIYYQLDLAEGARRLIVQWDNVQYNPIKSSNLTFQVQVYFTGKIVYAYKDVAEAAAADPSIGVINVDGTAAVTPTVRPANGDTLTFFGPATMPVTFAAPSGQISPRVQIGTDAFIDVEFSTATIEPGQFVVSEVNVNPPASVVDGQWVELENKTDNAFDLAGWELVFANGSIHTISSANGTTAIPPRGRLVLGQSAIVGDGVPVDYVYGSQFSLQRNGGKLAVGLAGGEYARFEVALGPTVPGYSVQRGSISNDPALLKTVGVNELICHARHASAYGTGQYGTPGQPNTPCPVYRYAGGSSIAEFEALATRPTANRIVFTRDSNESIDEISLYAPVRYGAQTFTKLWVSTNGFISLRPIACATKTDCLYANSTRLAPDAANSRLIAPFWDDLIANGTGGIWWERIEPNLLPNDGYTVVSWENFRHDTNNFTGSFNFQVRFYDTGDIDFVFGTMTGSTANLARGSSATTWLEDPTGLFAYKVNTNSATSPSITAMTSYRFVHE